jgi:L-threonylcarbamoyladenylate synthase
VRIDARGHRPEDVELIPAVEHLEGGGILAYPTETVYGLGCLLRAGAVERLRSAKRQGPHGPFLLLVDSMDSLDRLAWTPEARELAATFWPGSLTLILHDPHEAFPSFARGPNGTVAVRRSSHPLAARLLEEVGEPVTSTSANVPGGPPALTGEAAEAAAHALGLTPWVRVLDGGPLPPSEPSTIVDCSGTHPVVVRAGATPLVRLRCVLPEIHGN